MTILTRRNFLRGLFGSAITLASVKGALSKSGVVKSSVSEITEKKGYLITMPNSSRSEMDDILENVRGYFEDFGFDWRDTPIVFIGGEGTEVIEL